MFYETQNNIFLGWYWLELLLKLFGSGFAAYLSDAWNWLDIIVVLGSTMQYAIANSEKMARAFRVLRIFRLLPQLPQVVHHHSSGSSERWCRRCKRCSSACFDASGM